MDFQKQPVIVLDKVSKAYALFDSKLQRASHAILGRRAGSQMTRNVLNEISFSVSPGEMVGILGVNGAGKSTLLQIITGILRPTSGEVEVNGNIAALLELGAGFNPLWTGRENTRFQLQISGVEPSKIDAYLDEVEEFADIGVYFDQPVRTYSSGMFVRVAFAASIAVTPDILIVDEALAVGDARFQNKCYNRIKELKSQGTTILLVTHSLDSVVSFCDRGIVLEGGQITLDAPAKDAAEYYMSVLYGGGRAEPEDGKEASPQSKDDAGFEETHLGALLERVRSAKPDELSYLNKDAKNVGTGKATISTVALLSNGQLNLSGSIKTGDKVELVLEVLAHEDVQSPSVGILLKTIDGTQITVSANHMQGVVFPAHLAGVRRIYRAEFTASLAGGDYFVDVGFAEVLHGTHRSDDWRIGLVHLVVGATPRFLGPADLGMSIAEGEIGIE